MSSVIGCSCEHIVKINCAIKRVVTLLLLSCVWQVSDLNTSLLDSGWQTAKKRQSHAYQVNINFFKAMIVNFSLFFFFFFPEHDYSIQCWSLFRRIPIHFYLLVAPFIKVTTKNPLKGRQERFCEGSFLRVTVTPSGLNSHFPAESQKSSFIPRFKKK